MNPEERLAAIVTALESVGLSCLVMGGHAVRYYGLNRHTNDFDLTLAPDGWDDLADRLARTGLFPGGDSSSATSPTARRSGLSSGGVTTCSPRSRTFSLGGRSGRTAAGSYPSCRYPTSSAARRPSGPRTGTTSCTWRSSSMRGSTLGALRASSRFQSPFLRSGAAAGSTLTWPRASLVVVPWSVAHSVVPRTQ